MSATPSSAAAISSARAASSGVLTLKNGSTVVAVRAARCRRRARSAGDAGPRSRGSCRFRRAARKSSRSSASATGQSAEDRMRAGGRRRRARSSRSSLAAALRKARARGRPERTAYPPPRSRRSAPREGSLRDQRMPARMPASGPAKPSIVSATTGRPYAAKRAGSPLALMTMPLDLRAQGARSRARASACRRPRPAACRRRPCGVPSPPARMMPACGWRADRLVGRCISGGSRRT